MYHLRSFFSRHWPGIALFLVALLAGLITYQDYGVSWDEHIQRGIGRISYAYIFKGDTTLRHFEDREYGVSYELVLTMIEKKCGMTGTRDIFLMRHWVNHLFFLLCVFCAYLLIQRLFNKHFLSCLGFAMIAFHPRLYAHSFFNSKDIPFLGIFLVSLLLAHIAFQKKRGGWYALLGVACGYAAGIRILGIMLVAILGLFMIIDIFSAAAEKRRVQTAVSHLLLFLAASFLTLYAAMPFLWEAPVENFTATFTKLSHFPWSGTVLFDGKTYVGKNLPWFYLPGWMCVTTPVLWVVAGGAGALLLLAAFARRPLHYIKNTPGRNFLLYALCFFLPLLSVILLRSVVYDDWRHVYFIYPSFVMLGLYALNKLPPGRLKLILYSACIVQVIAASIFMIRFHPFQQVYFNQLASHKEEQLRKNYDLEYWGCSFKQGLDYVLAHDTASIIRIQQTILPLDNNLKLLTAADRSRIQVVSEDAHPDYFITNFRSHPEDYDYPVVFYEIKVQNSTIMRVYKLH